MHHQFNISPQEGTRAKWPHEIFLINLIFNHIKAKRIAASDESWYVKAHWQIGAMRNRHFKLLLTIACIISAGGFWISKMLGWAKIPTITLIGGVGLLPFMVLLLILIVLGNESVFMAREGKLPKRFVEQSQLVQAQQSLLIKE